MLDEHNYVVLHEDGSPNQNSGIQDSNPPPQQPSSPPPSEFSLPPSSPPPLAVEEVEVDGRQNTSITVTQTQSPSPQKGFVAIRMPPKPVRCVAVKIKSATPATATTVPKPKHGCIICTRQIQAIHVFGHKACSFSPYLSKLLFPLTKNITAQYDEFGTNMASEHICTVCRRGLSASTKYQQEKGILSYVDRVNHLLEPLVELESAVSKLRTKMKDLLTSHAEIEDVFVKNEVVNDDDVSCFPEDEGMSKNEVRRKGCEKENGVIKIDPVDQEDDDEVIEMIDIADSPADHVPSTTAGQDSSPLCGLFSKDVRLSVYYKNKSSTSTSPSKVKETAEKEIKKSTTEQPEKDQDSNTCSVCQKVFEDKTHLEGHMITHIEDWRVECDICHKTFYHKSTLKVHKRRHEGNRKHQCNTCDKTFVTGYELKSHAKTHGKPKKPPRTEARIWTTEEQTPRGTKKSYFECPICNRVLSGSQHLTQHLRIHTNEKPYECNLCHQKFRQNSSLFLHKRRHEGDLRYCCSFCDRRFVNHYQMKVHEQTHIPISDRVRNITCQYCPKTFTSKPHYEIHIRRIHPECINSPKYPSDKLPSCDVCGKKFLKELYLEKHMVKHDPAKKLESICDICGRGLTHIYSLRRHMKAVHGKVPGTSTPKTFPCPTCGKMFTTSGGMKRHVSEQHVDHLRKIACQICGKELRPATIRVHMRNHQRGDRTKKKTKTKEEVSQDPQDFNVQDDGVQFYDKDNSIQEGSESDSEFIIP